MMRHSYTRDLIGLFISRPGEWFDGLALAKLAGAYAWRTRISEARRILRAACVGDVENLQIRARGHATISMYRFTPRREVG